MRLIRGLFIVAMLGVALVSADNTQAVDPPKQQRYPKRHLGGNTDVEDARNDNQAVGNDGFDVHNIKYSSSEDQSEFEEKKQSSSSTIPIVAGVGACACIGLLGAVYMKRRKDNDKLAGEIFTIDDKNSVL
uniref:Uncharacterized protein n=1 Tax=Peronospora matthiolae TaxID=2874970 RepID=A0AAV1UFC2_9STRA